MSPLQEHFDDVKHLIRYLHGIANYYIIYNSISDENANLIKYSNSNFRACRLTRRSTENYIFMLNEGPISWSSKRQSTVALSTTEAEYYALSQAIKEAS